PSVTGRSNSAIPAILERKKGGQQGAGHARTDLLPDRGRRASGRPAQRHPAGNPDPGRTADRTPRRRHPTASRGVGERRDHRRRGHPAATPVRRPAGGTPRRGERRPDRLLLRRQRTRPGRGTARRPRSRTRRGTGRRRTRAVADPGYRLVTACVAADVPITVIPGPSAVSTALVLSGLPTDRFCFEGFPPRRGLAGYLAELADERRTLVFFEAPHRLAATLTAMPDAVAPHRPAAVGRAPTKTYEEVRPGRLADLAAAPAGHAPR